MARGLLTALALSQARWCAQNKTLNRMAEGKVLLE